MQTPPNIKNLSPHPLSRKEAVWLHPSITKSIFFQLGLLVLKKSNSDALSMPKLKSNQIIDKQQKNWNPKVKNNLYCWIMSKTNRCLASNYKGKEDSLLPIKEVKPRKALFRLRDAAKMGSWGFLQSTNKLKILLK